MLSFKQISAIVPIASSPFYLCDDQRFAANFDRIATAFASQWPNFILAYSYKTNYIPYLCKIIKDKGGWAEVVSRLEYDLAIKVGQSPAKIIFNGPVKSEDDIALAINNGSIVNVDSMDELNRIVQFAQQNPDKQIPIGLRINMGLTDSGGASQIQNHLPVSRFGFDPKNLSSDICHLISRNNLKVISLHGHTSTAGRSLACYQTIAQTLCGIAETYFPDTVEYINVGGGIFGHVPECMGFGDVPAVDQYARTIADVLHQSPWAAAKKPALVLEPGIAMVADVLTLITKVVAVKTIKDKTLVTVDGSIFHAKPTMHTRNQPWECVAKDDAGRPESTFSVVGSTCMEKDYLLTEVTGPLPQAGDYIAIGQAGAYSVVMTPPFIHPAPAIVVPHGENFKLIRSRQLLDDMFRNYSF